MEDKKTKTLPGQVWDWVVLLFRLPTRLTHLERRITDSMKVQGQLLKVLIEMAGALPNEEQQKQFAKQLMDLLSSFVDDTLERESMAMNPLTFEELERLKDYYNGVKHGRRLNEEGARDFAALAQKLQAGREAKGETDIGAIVLAGIAGLILGIILGSGDK